MTNDLNQDQRMHRICNTLKEEGYIVTLVGRKKPNSKPLYPQAFDQHRFNMFCHDGILFYLEYHIRLFIYLLFSNSPDLLFSVDLDTALPVSLVSFLRRSKSIHDAHELFTEVPELQSSPVKRCIWNWVGKRTMKSFDHRFTVNDSLVKILTEKYDCKFTCVRNFPFIKKTSKSKLEVVEPYIWYQGVLNEGRGLEQMIEAMPLLPDLHLRIAGEGDRSLTLRLQAENSAAANRIHFHGWMNAEDMHNWASNAWIGINLLDHEAGSYYHSLANRTFDFVQAALPTIHMDFPEYRSIVKQYGIGVLLSRLESKSIVKTIEKLEGSAIQYDIIKKACIKYKSQLTWENESKKLSEVLRDLIK